jgi:hypothetical protein
MSPIILIFIYTAVTVVFLALLWRIKRVNPVFWLLVFQWVIATGTFMVIDLRQGIDSLYAMLFFLALISFGVGGTVTLSVGNVNRKFNRFFVAPVEEDASTTKYLTYGLVAFSALICIMYYRAIGYNLFIQSLTSANIIDFKSARIATYSGETYFAPGYVNQFKNVIFPTGSAIICMWWRRRASFPNFTIILIFFVLSNLYFLLGTGQRAPMVFAFIGIMFGISTLRSINLKFVLPGLLLIVFFFGLFSVLNQRTDVLNVATALYSLGERIFVNDQEEGLWGFRYVVTLEPAWFSNWAEAFAGLLPSNKGSFLDHELYYRIHNTTRGTSSLSTVGSAYYNGGIVNVIFFYLFLGCFYALVYLRLLSGKRTVLRCMSYGGLAFLLSVFVAGNPVVLLNKGLLGLILLLMIRKLRIYPASEAIGRSNSGWASLAAGSKARQ